MNYQSLMSDIKKQMDDVSPASMQKMGEVIFRLSRELPLVISQIRNLQHRAEGIITVCTRQTVMVDSLSTCQPGTRGTLRVIGCLATLMLLTAAWYA